jgi:hypothetical protein
MRRPGDRIDRHQFFRKPVVKLTDVMAGLGLSTAMWELSKIRQTEAESARYCPESVT